MPVKSPKQKAARAADRKIPGDFTDDRQTRESVNKKGGLTIGSLGQFLDRSIPRDLAQLASEDLVSISTDFGRSWKLLDQVFAHSDGLSALAGKQQRDFHCVV